MNFVIFASLLLVISTAVLAFPDSGIPGGVNPADVNSPEIQELAKKFVAKLDADAGSGCTQKVSKVLSATKQVVAGKKTALKVEVCQDTCIDKTLNTDECKICSASIYERPWENFIQINDVAC